jgi:hypothetical protein
MIAIYIFYAYIVIGFCFALFFVFWGAEKIHHSIKGGGIGLKLLLLPASVILWPYLLKRIIQKK